MSERQVLAALGVAGGASRYVSHEDAVRIGRALHGHSDRRRRFRIFGVFSSGRRPRATGLPLAVSSTLHAGVFVAAIFLTTVGLTPAAATAVNARFDSDAARVRGVAGSGWRRRRRRPAAENTAAKGRA